MKEAQLICPQPSVETEAIRIRVETTEHSIEKAFSTLTEKQNTEITNVITSLCEEFPNNSSESEGPTNNENSNEIHVGFFDTEYFGLKAWQISIMFPFLKKTFSSFVKIDESTLTETEKQVLSHLSIAKSDWRRLTQNAPSSQIVAHQLTDFLKAIPHRIHLYHYFGNDHNVLKEFCLNNSEEIPPQVTILDIGYPIKHLINIPIDDDQASQSNSSKLKQSAADQKLHKELSTEESTFKRLKCSLGDHDARVDCVKTIEVVVHTAKKYAVENQLSGKSESEFCSLLVKICNLFEEHKRNKKNRKRSGEVTQSRKRPKLDAEKEARITTFLQARNILISGRLEKAHMQEFLKSIKKKQKTRTTFPELASIVLEVISATENSQNSNTSENLPQDESPVRV